MHFRSSTTVFVHTQRGLDAGRPAAERAKVVAQACRKRADQLQARSTERLERTSAILALSRRRSDPPASGGIVEQRAEAASTLGVPHGHS